MKVVRIGDSPLAPVFEVLSRPNQWERRLQSIAQETRQISELGQFRLDFWTNYLKRHPEDEKYGAAGAASSTWRSLDDLSLAVTLWVGKKSTGIFVRGPRGSDPGDIYDILASQSERLEELIGVPLKESDGGHFLAREIQGDNSDPAQRDVSADWLYEHANIYEAALREVLTDKV